MKEEKEIDILAYLPIYNQIPNVVGLGLVLPLCYSKAWKGKKDWRKAEQKGEAGEGGQEDFKV